MAAGSGPEPTEDIPTTAPEGWVVVRDPALPGGFVYRPDRGHSIHPYNAALRKRPELRTWLAQDPELQGYVRANRDRIHEAFRAAQARRDELIAAVPTANAADIAAFASLVRGLLTEVLALIDRASNDLGRKDVPRWVRLHYLVGELIPPDLQSEELQRFIRPESVAIFADIEGAITMVFTGATENERRAWEPLIRSAQRHFRFRKGAGGRPRRADQASPAASTDPRVVARLVRQGRPLADTAHALHAVYPDDDWLRPYEAGDEARIAHRVARYAADGEAALAAGPRH